jgi:hypothetical protein
LNKIQVFKNNGKTPREQKMKTLQRTPQYLNWQRIKASLLLGMAPALAFTPMQLQAAEGRPLVACLTCRPPL